jgi:transposase
VVWQGQCLVSGHSAQLSRDIVHTSERGCGHVAGTAGVTAVKVEGRSKSEVARDYRVSRRWVHELVKRFDAEGEAGLAPRSRRPRASPQRTPQALADEVVALRKHLAEQGLDAGAVTVAYHLEQRHGAAPAPSTIWRILSRRGFVTPQPQKRPKSSYVRFEAAMPNERWQADITHWKLAGGAGVEALNLLDDHSRYLVASDARAVTKAADVVTTFHQAAKAHGFPASMLADNGAVFTPHHAAVAAAPSNSSSPPCRSPTATPAPTTRRPAARSNASTRP